VASDEEANLVAVARSDSDEIDRAWRLHGPKLIQFATALVGPADAHDVTVTAFLRSTKRLDWGLIERFDRYLLRAVRNEAKNLERQRRRQWQRDIAAVRPTSSDDQHRDIDLLAAIAELSLQQRSVVFFAYWEDMTEAQIADTLGLSRGTVHRNLQRARTTLRKAIT